MSAKTHSGLINLILLELTNRGCRAWKNATGTALSLDGCRVIKYGCLGSPDIIGLTATGRFIGVECKVGYDQQREGQAAFQRMIEKQNGIYILARDVEDVVIRLNDDIGLQQIPTP
jgi:hypothetical protein